MDEVVKSHDEASAPPASTPSALTPGALTPSASSVPLPSTPPQGAPIAPTAPNAPTSGVQTPDAPSMPTAGAPTPGAPGASNTPSAPIAKALRVLQACSLGLFILVTLIALVGIIADKFLLSGSLSFFVIHSLITNTLGQLVLQVGTTLFVPLVTSKELWAELLGIALPLVLVLAGFIAMRRLKRKGKAGAVARPIVCFLLTLFVATFALSLSYIDYVGYITRHYVLSDEGIDPKDFSRIQKLIQEDKLFAQMVIDTVCLELKDPALTLDDLDDEEYLEAAEMVALCFQIKCTVSSQEEHYLRNYFYRAPQTLDDMLKEIRAGSPFAWTLLAQDQTVYHMQGSDGAYNLKFVSEDGYHEAIYNEDGILLTEKNDPVNMGTFNYASPLSAPALHATLDVLPYYSYGNSPASSTSSPENYDYKNNPDAQKRWQELHDLLSSYQH